MDEIASICIFFLSKSRRSMSHSIPIILLSRLFCCRRRYRSLQFLLYIHHLLLAFIVPALMYKQLRSLRQRGGCAIEKESALRKEASSARKARRRKERKTMSYLEDQQRILADQRRQSFLHSDGSRPQFESTRCTWQHLVEKKSISISQCNSMWTTRDQR